MKKIILSIITLLFAAPIFAQKELDSLSYSNSQNINFFKHVKNNTQVKTYITAGNNTIQVGDTIVLGAPTSQELNSRTYSGSYGNTTSVGASNTRSTSNTTYEYIKLGRPAGFGSIMNAMSGEADYMADVSYKNTKVIVKEIKAYHRGSKKKPLYLVLVLGEINDRAFGVNKYLSVMDTELAIEYGEVQLLNRKMTRAEAITKLKEAKELYEIEMMSKDEFDALKLELGPIIKGNAK